MYNFTNNIELVKTLIEEHHAELLHEVEVYRLLKAQQEETQPAEKREPFPLFKRVQHGIARAIAIAF